MSDPLSLAYLVAATLASLLVIVLALRLSRRLAELIAPGFTASSITPSQQLLLVRLVLLGLALIASQALLRWPLALVLARDGSAVQADAGVAAAALAGVLALLVWVYQTARPMLQTVILRAIDAAVPTTGEALVAEPTRASFSMAQQPIPSSTDSVTVVAPLFVAPLSGEATVVAGRDADATVRADRQSDATVRDETDAEATLRVRDA